MKDYIVRATAADNQIRAFAITGRNLTEQARQCHNTSPIVSAALGRLLCAGAMMGVMMKGDDDCLTLQVKGDGPLKGMTVTANARGRVKGYPIVPDVMLPINSLGKLDVGGALGHGLLSVMKDMGLKEPYASQTALQTGEIGDDLSYYFATSEQVPSAVGLGVLMEKNNTVKQAGGFIIQLLPFCEESVIEKLEQKVAAITSVTDLLEAKMTPEMLLEQILGEFGLEINEQIMTEFSCDCSRERVTKAIISIGKKEVGEMIADGKPIEVNCHFCNKSYEFTPAELKEIIQ